jgi:flavin reductase (DIM6/NTAB) family NADH-FMN oxidoreductase RutF
MPPSTSAFDFETLPHMDAYKLMTSLIVPRPIAWVTTRSKSGVVNAAPFSFFNAVGATPPTIVLGLGLREDKLKDTTKNLIETGEFAVHVVTEELAEAMNLTAVDAPPDVSETSLAGLELAPCVKITAPRIAASPAAFECRVTQIIDIGAGQRLIVAHIIEAHIHNDAFENRERFHIATERLKIVGRMNGPAGYTRTDGRFEITRPVWPLKK